MWMIHRGKPSLALDPRIFISTSHRLRPLRPWVERREPPFGFEYEHAVSDETRAASLRDNQGAAPRNLPPTQLFKLFNGYGGQVAEL